MSTGSFLQVAKSKFGTDPSFCDAIIIYDKATDIPIANMTATAINAAIAAKTIIGVIRGWSTVAAASVAEKNVERANGEVNLMKGEILGDVLTFRRTFENAKVLASLVEGSTYDCIIIDDNGKPYGKRSLKPQTLSTAKFNFSNKATNGLQNDQTNENTIAVNVRYLLTDAEMGTLDVIVETELIESKSMLYAEIASITTQTTSSIVFVMNLREESEGDLLTTFVTTDLDIDVEVNGHTVTGSATFASNQLTVTLAKTVADFSTTTNLIGLALDTSDYYLPRINFNTATFA